MKFSIRRTRSIALRHFLLLFVVGCGSAVQVASSAAETGLVRQVFACNFVDGAGVDDLLAARDYMLEQLPAIGVEPRDAFLWTPFKGNFTYDGLWFENYDNLNQWGSDADIWDASSEGALVDARFDAVNDCVSSLAVRETIYEGGEPFDAGGQALISSSACALNEGKNINDVRALLATLKATLDGTGLHKTFLAYMSTPLTSSSDRDLYFYGVHPSASSYAARSTALQTSNEGEALAAQFNATLDCNNSLWWAQQVVGGE